ncbi:cyclic nucleotide-binding domain-containing protein [Fodinibius halophilus]|uniref:Cyclic nucleotide-binding domain-containing protein n=1 Tax=Fodinibius halophilus TaxID=1736908 RepID=A0A6M1TCU1_9BACT|nr:cyclic nucleotide-binding domain-containing protein [Fodinibius halophilus]NGP87992.1 cyclic nucleotide-binding domain-containing protein [Fodinibius halophilus]
MTTENQAEKEAAPEYIRQFLKEPPLLLRNFHYEDIMEFLKLGQLEKFVQDDIIINEEEYVNSAYLIAEGKVSIWKDNIQLATLSKGNFLGETFLFSKNNRMAKVVSEGDIQLLKFERYEALNFFRKKPEKLFNIFTRNIIEIQQKKISNMNIQLLQLKKRLLDDTSW